MKLKCRVINERYYNEDTSYGVYIMKSDSKDCSKLIRDNPLIDGIDTVFKEDLFSDEYSFTMTGNMQKLDYMEDYLIDFSIKYSKKYKSYNVVPSIVDRDIPKTYEQSEKFLKSLLTAKQTKNLLSIYPDIVERIMQNKEIDIDKLEGIGEKTLKNISNKVIDNYVISDLLIMLSPLGVSFKKIKKISNLSDNPSLIKEQITNNPYILTSINGLGFKTVDDLALKINPKLKISKLRAESFIDNLLYETANSQGHTYLYRNEIIEQARYQIRPCLEIVKQLISEIQTNNKYFVLKDMIGLQKNYNHEKNIKNHLDRINESGFDFNTLSNDCINDLITNIEEKQGFNFSQEQVETIKNINTNDNNVIVLSGSAGTGKTTVISAMIEVLNKMENKKHEHPEISLCALSARASIRMQEATGVKASTIHSLLGSSDESGEIFQYNSNNHLSSDVIIVDELSMVNIFICDSLFQAVKNGAKLILVFDHAQLSPIGAGAVAYDLLEYSNFIKYKYTDIHRQAKASGIISGANLVRKQKTPIKEFKKTCSGELKDMFYLFSNDKEKIRNYAIKQFFKVLENNSIDDIFIIVPRKNKVTNSAEEINNIIQSKLIPHGSQKELSFLDKCFRIGDKVIERKNDKERNIFNGEVGYVDNIILKKDGAQSDKLIVKYKDYVGNKEFKYVEYNIDNLKSLKLGYALTTHSFQGSQCNNIITILDSSHYQLLDCTMLYTAMTRAKKKCMIISEPKAFQRCIKVNKTIKRNTFLKLILESKNGKLD